ncbi:para-aminobenzoate (PABA) synthase family protein [Klebsormidium nitens]|uniref:aminodeoxychorismate synthase n=1 Tax=Klebsormidium nitens TaxID=105231 RepID=A0A1Y1I7E4_KLENI|nr:para-aminobenzoate (PABA) synthase family protein [Klebsormidium nitens]|eukprot:GAQ84637.1 para-aminobenzoate (PABA) synthase family protein [Klebsormidium nitens]
MAARSQGVSSLYAKQWSHRVGTLRSACKLTGRESPHKVLSQNSLRSRLERASPHQVSSLGGSCVSSLTLFQQRREQRRSQYGGHSKRRSAAKRPPIRQLAKQGRSGPAQCAPITVQGRVEEPATSERPLSSTFHQFTPGKDDSEAHASSSFAPAPEAHHLAGSSSSLSLSSASKVVRTLLIDNYDSYTYNLYQMLAVINGAPPVTIFNDQLSWEELRPLLLGPSRAFDNVVISPGPGTPEKPQDTGICARVFAECPDLPVLGVCLGHQLLAHVHGATVTHAPQPVHGRLSEVEHTGHRLFAGIPSGATAGFKVVRYHSLIVDPSTLPAHLVPTAWTVPGAQPSSNAEPAKESTSAKTMAPINGKGNHSSNGLHSAGNGGAELLPLEDTRLPTAGAPSFASKITARGTGPDLVAGGIPRGSLLMGVSHRWLPHHGVQFHPESIATAYGERLLRNFFEMTVERWNGNPAGTSNGQHAQLVNGQHSKRLEALCQGGEWLCSIDNSVNGQARDSEQSMGENGGQDKGFSGVPAQLGLAPERTDLPLEVQPGRHRVVWQKLADVLTDGCDSEELFMQLYGRAGGEEAFWLDSSSTAAGRGRFSFMGGKGGDLWRKVTYFLEDAAEQRPEAGPVGGRLIVQDAGGKETEERLAGSIFDYLEEELRTRRCPPSDVSALPFDFCGGFVGYLGYELKRECGAAANKHASPFPDAAFFLADRLIAVDHTEGDVYLMELVDTKTGQAAEASAAGSDDVVDYAEGSRQIVASAVSKEGNTLEESENASRRPVNTSWIDTTADFIRTLSEAAKKKSTINEVGNHRDASIPAEAKDNRPADGVAGTTASQYVADVQKCMDEIRDGETYEVCLTTRLHPAAAVADPLSLYRHLRNVNPAPYSAWLSLGAAGPAVVCCSPERFLKLDRHGVLEAKPIKGTSPRGVDAAEDAWLREQLRTSPKERAENLMIVDLLRNDLGKVCQVGSVHVPSLMAIESFATVHQLVSTVRGRKRPDVGPLACVRAGFPAGSMTGAPKLRTMEIIDGIEDSARGVYSGALGFFSVNGTFDLNVVIRTATWHEDRVTIGAGGAVVALSEPEAEYAEMLLKAQALLKAIKATSKAGRNGSPVAAAK